MRLGSADFPTNPFAGPVCSEPDRVEATIQRGQGPTQALGIAMGHGYPELGLSQNLIKVDRDFIG